MSVFKNLERIKIMSKDLNIIQFSYSKDLQPLVEDVINDVREFFKTREQNELALSQAKLKASKEKWDAALKAINKNGAFDKIMLQAADKYLGKPEVPPKINNPTSKFDGKNDSLVSLLAELMKQLNSDSDFKFSLISAINNISVSSAIHNLLKCTNEDDARMILAYIVRNTSGDDIPHLLKLNDMLDDSERELVGKIVNFKL